MYMIDFTTDKEQRDHYVSRTEVLDKVKNLLLIPGSNGATIQMIADFYEVDLGTAKKCYQRNKDEINSDGSILQKMLEFQKGQNVPFEKSQRYAIFHFMNGVSVYVPNRGVRIFSKRAILRFGMLLRDSSVAKEVRHQLLNCMEVIEPVQIEQATSDEFQLQMNLANAFYNGSTTEMLSAAKAIFDCQNAHIQALKLENKALAKEILEWDNRTVFTKAVRILSGMMQTTYGKLYNLIYNELLYKHHINLQLRRAHNDYIGNNVDYIREDEWKIVHSVIAALCESHDISYETLMKKVGK